MRRTIMRLLGLSLAAVAVILYVNWTGDRNEPSPDPALQLQCAGGNPVAAAYATAPPTAKEVRTPEQLAKAWAKVRSPSLLPSLHRVYEEPDHVDIGFDSKAHTVAVLTFRTHEKLGWHLDAVVACQQPETQRKTPSSSPSGP